MVDPQSHGPPPVHPTEKAPHGRRPVRVISALDCLGLRYLSGDLHVLAGLGAWPLPLAVGAIGPAGDELPWAETAGLEAHAQRLAQADRSMDLGVLKTGQLLSAARVARVAEYVQDVRPAHYVIDPELFDQGGRPRTATAVRDTTRTHLLLRATVLVANRHEASALSGREVDGPGSMRDACKALFDLGLPYVVLTGAHLEGFPRDLFHDGTGFEELGADRIRMDGRLLGAGGVFSSALCAGLAQGLGVLEAAHGARLAVNSALRDRWWVTATGLVSADQADLAASPRGYWVANPTGLSGTLEASSDRSRPLG